MFNFPFRPGHQVSRSPTFCAIQISLQLLGQNFTYKDCLLYNTGKPKTCVYRQQSQEWYQGHLRVL